MPYRWRIAVTRGKAARGWDQVSSAVTGYLADRRLAVVRFGAVACTAIAAVVGLARFDEALGLFDWRADTNAALPYLVRLYGDDGVVPDRSVVEDARARMPRDALYRVVIGPKAADQSRWSPHLFSDFLRYFLAPRRQTEAASAEWAFCLGCDTPTLGEGFVVLAEGDGGFLFGRASS